MFTKNTSFSEFLTTIKDWKGCSESIEWCKKIRDVKPDLTLGEAIEQLELDPTKDHQSWAVGSLIIYDGLLDSDIRKSFIKKITDPMSAFSLYINLKNLTNEEDRLLEEKFKGKLPTAELELLKGIVKRNKHGSNGL